jgi:heat shock protein HslJ
VSVLVTENGKSKQLVSGTKIRLGFSDGRLSASAGCNHMSGDYDISDGALMVGQMATTEMGCPADLSDQDQWLADFLASGPDVTLNGNELSLANATTQIDFLDREVAEPDQPLTMITWGLTTMLDGDTASSVPQGVTATLLFMDDGTVEIGFGCNSGGGQYAVNGDELTFSQIVSTKMACQGDNGAVESAVTSVLNAESITWSIDHSTLTLQTPDGHGLQYAAAVDTSTDY